VADYEINVGRELLPGLLNGPEWLAKLVETVLNQVLEAQMTEHLGAEPHVTLPWFCGHLAFRRW